MVNIKLIIRDFLLMVSSIKRTFPYFITLRRSSFDELLYIISLYIFSYDILLHFLLFFFFISSSAIDICGEHLQNGCSTSHVPDLCSVILQLMKFSSVEYYTIYFSSILSRCLNYQSYLVLLFIAPVVNLEILF